VRFSGLTEPQPGSELSQGKGGERDALESLARSQAASLQGSAPIAAGAPALADIQGTLDYAQVGDRDVPTMRYEPTWGTSEPTVGFAGSAALSRRSASGHSVVEADVPHFPSWVTREHAPTRDQAPTTHSPTADGRPASPRQSL
jgi:hypothetical protein